MIPRQNLPIGDRFWRNKVDFKPIIGFCGIWFRVFSFTSYANTPFLKLLRLQDLKVELKMASILQDYAALLRVEVMLWEDLMNFTKLLSVKQVAGEHLDMRITFYRNRITAQYPPEALINVTNAVK